MFESGITPWHVVLLLVMVATVVVWIMAIVSIVKHPTANTTAKTIWILIVVIFPLLGSAVWFVTGRTSLGKGEPGSIT